jgi:hypothetical protein
MSTYPPPPPPPPPWRQPQYPSVVQPTTEEPARGLAIAALVCGIVGVVVGLIPILFVATLALGLVALVLGGIAWTIRRRAHVKRGVAIAGTILGVLALTLGIVGVVIVNNAFNDLGNDLDQIDQPEG